jgi:hypothetical protein
MDEMAAMILDGKQAIVALDAIYAAVKTGQKQMLRW